VTPLLSSAGAPGGLRETYLAAMDGQDEAAERVAPSGKIVYRAILAEGEEELSRPSPALFWSGIAAGLSMGFSLVAEALLTTYLPEARWSRLVTKLGYSLGFIIVVLGRQQLFTENTLTVVLPLLQRKTAAVTGNVLRLWAVVLLANLIGASLVALAIVRAPTFDLEVQATAARLGQEAVAHGASATFARAIFAGWLIALMVWLMPFAESGRLGMIVILTYAVGLGGFPHIVAGAVEVAAAAWAHAITWGQVAAHLAPTLAGNIVGGVAMVAMLNHAQVVSGGGKVDG
jgi:formate/nitrite transporter FocA (FNT family)